MSIPPSSRHLHVLSTIARAKAAGATVQAISQATGQSTDEVRMHIKNIVAGRKAMPGKKPGTRNQVYVLAAYYAEYVAENAPQAGAPASSTMPPRATSITVCTMAQERQYKLSAERIAVEKVLANAKAPMTPKAIAGAAKLDMTFSNRILQTLKQAGMAVNVGVGKAAMWRSPSNTKPATERAPRLCNSTQPTMITAPRMVPARADALKHLEVFSRRGDTYVPARAPMLISSGIGGGMR